MKLHAGMLGLIVTVIQGNLGLYKPQTLNPKSPGLLVADRSAVQEGLNKDQRAPLRKVDPELLILTV